MKSIGKDFSFKFEIDLYTSDMLTGLNEVFTAPSILSRDSTDLMAVAKGLDDNNDDDDDDDNNDDHHPPHHCHHQHHHHHQQHHPHNHHHHHCHHHCHYICLSTQG